MHLRRGDTVSRLVMVANERDGWDGPGGMSSSTSPHSAEEVPARRLGAEQASAGSPRAPSGACPQLGSVTWDGGNHCAS